MEIHSLHGFDDKSVCYLQVINILILILYLSLMEV